jgi:hypothetical protein
MMLDTKTTFDELVRHARLHARERASASSTTASTSTSRARSRGRRSTWRWRSSTPCASDSNYDLIVLDTPPTSNALDFLDAPERLDRRHRLARHALVRAGLRIRARAASGWASWRSASTVLIKGLAKFTGIEFLEEVAGFVTGINDLFGGFREHATAGERRAAQPGGGLRGRHQPEPHGHPRGHLLQRTS